MIASTIGEVLRPIQQQLSKLTGDAPEPPSTLSTEMKDLKLEQQKLMIETKAASISSPGGQSQYRSIAALSMKLSNALEDIDDLMLTRPSPDDDVYKSLSQIKEKIIDANSDATQRIDLIFKAESDPKLGWKAVSLYEEKERLGTKDPEKDKAFQSCLKQVQEAHKKATSHRSTSYRPFRSAPGGHPGSSASTGDVEDKFKAQNCFLKHPSIFSFFVGLGLLPQYSS